MIISKVKSKLDGNKSLFDFQTETTDNNKYDIILNPQGQLSRIIGIDKLSQQILKYLLVEKGTYENSSIGTIINDRTKANKSENAIKSDIIESLKVYSTYQITSSNIETNILGWEIYRTKTPDIDSSWVKLNKHLISNNFYYDSNLKANEVYYYSVTKVSKVNNRPVSSGVGTYLEVIIPDTNTKNAIVGDDFIVIPQYGSVTLYWKQDIGYQTEEVLRSLTKLLTWYTVGEPRNLNIYLQLTNLDNTTTEVTTR